MAHVFVSENYSIKVESWTWSWNRDGVKFDLRSCLWEIRCWLIFVNFMKCHNFLKFHKILQVLIFFFFFEGLRDNCIESFIHIFFETGVTRQRFTTNKKEIHYYDYSSPKTINSVKCHIRCYLLNSLSFDILFKCWFICIPWRLHFNLNVVKVYSF